MSVSGIWPCDAGAYGNEKRRSKAPGRSHRPDQKAQPKIARRLLPWWLIGAGTGLVGALLLDLAGNGAQRALVLLYGVVHTASVLLVTASLTKHPGAHAAEDEDDKPPGETPPEAPPPADPEAPAHPVPDPWAADTVPVLPAADSSPTFRP